MKSLTINVPDSFDLTTKEVMEVIDGTAFVSINGNEEETFTNNQSWVVEAGGYFIVRCDAPLHYVCHFEGV